MGNVLKKSLPYAAGALAGGVSNQFAATKPFSAAISAGAGALTNSKKPLQGALQGFVGGGVGSAVGGGLTSKTGFGGGAMEGLKTYGSSIPGFGGIGTSNPTGVMAKFLTPQSIQNPSATRSLADKMTTPGGSAGLGNAYGRSQSGLDDMMGTSKYALPSVSPASTGGAPASTMASPIVQNKGVTQSFMPKGIDWKGMAGGAAVSMMGDMFTKDVPASDFSPVLNPLRERINNDSPLKTAAVNEYMNTINRPNANVEPALANIKLISDRQRAENLRAINQQFAAAMPGANYTNSSEYANAIAKMNTEMDRNYSAQVAQTQFEYDMAQKQQAQAAAGALAELDQAQIQSLANLAQYDIYAISEQTGYDLQKSQAVKDLAAKAGEFIMGNAAGAYNVQQPQTGVAK